MASYVILANYTAQGISKVKDTVKRAETAKSMAGKFGVKITDIVWTLGQYDLMITVEAPNDEALAAFSVSIGMQGNIKTQTLRAFHANEVETILAKLQ